MSNACIRFPVLLAFIILFCLISPSYAADSIFTVQTGSFRDEPSAIRQFDSIKDSLTQNELEHLRIENIGKFYTVRIGKFDNREAADGFLNATADRLPPAVVIDAYFLGERIVRKFEIPSKAEAPSIETSEKQIEMISALFNEKKFEEALKISLRAVGSSPEDPLLNGWHGSVLLKLDQPEKAVEYFSKASELKPDIADYHNGKGYSHYYLKQYNEAVSAFEKALSIDPENIDALSGLGAAYLKSGNKDMAMDAYNKLKNIDKDSAEQLLQMIKGESGR